MSEQFAPAAIRCNAMAAQLLGWRPAEFWSATPAELARSLQPIDTGGAAEAPSREQIAQMMERDQNG